jgi:hypothetical protein
MWRDVTQVQRLRVVSEDVPNAFVGERFVGQLSAAVDWAEYAPTVNAGGVTPLSNGGFRPARRLPASVERSGASISRSACGDLTKPRRYPPPAPGYWHRRTHETASRSTPHAERQRSGACPLGEGPLAP